MKTRKILGFGLPEEKKTAVMAICRFIGARYTSIQETDMHKTVGFLCKAIGVPESVPEYDIPGKNAPEGEMLVFAGFDGEDLNVFLEKYRKTGIPSVLYKAILTEYNALWSPVFLYCELQKEHLEIQRNQH